MRIFFDPLLNSRDLFPYPTIVNKLEIFIREKPQRWYPIFPRVSTFSAPLYLNRLLGKTGTFREPRSSIFPRNLVPLPPFLSIHPSRSRYLHESTKVPAFFSGQLTISFKWHIWSTVLLDAGIPAVIFLPRHTTATV